jgi:hypothetical protein
VEEEGYLRNASMWVLCNDDKYRDDEGRVDSPFKEGTEEEDANVDGDNHIGSDASPKTNVKVSSHGDSMSSLARDAIEFGANRDAAAADDGDKKEEENLKQDIEADSNIPRPSKDDDNIPRPFIIKEEVREL